MAAYWPEAEEDGKIKDYMNGIAKICVSWTLTEPGWNNARIVSDPVRELSALKAEEGKTIFILGRAELAASLMRDGLIDEIRNCIAPTAAARLVGKAGVSTGRCSGAPDH